MRNVKLFQKISPAKWKKNIENIYLQMYSYTNDVKTRNVWKQWNS